MKFDPYETLDIDRDADEATIRAAAKAHAKRTHPDAGGTTAAFLWGRKALAILINPARREKYDRTGNSDDEPHADQITGGAFEVIFAHLGEMLNAYLASGQQDHMDPRRLDVIGHIRLKIAGNIAGMTTNLASGRRQLEVLKDIARRFTIKTKKPNMIARGLENQARRVASDLKELEKRKAMQEMALKLLDEYDFERDPPILQGWTTVTMSASTSRR